jgi:hypothetical protein
MCQIVGDYYPASCRQSFAVLFPGGGICRLYCCWKNIVSVVVNHIPQSIVRFAHDNKVAVGSFIPKQMSTFIKVHGESLNATHLIMLYKLPKIVVHQSIELASLYTQREYDECGCVKLFGHFSFAAYVSSFW